MQIFQPKKTLAINLAFVPFLSSSRQQSGARARVSRNHTSTCCRRFLSGGFAQSRATLQNSARTNVRRSPRKEVSRVMRLLSCSRGAGGGGSVDRDNEAGNANGGSESENGEQPVAAGTADRRRKPRRKLIYTVVTFAVMGMIGCMVNVVFGAMYTSGNESSTEGLLYPIESETREMKKLDGMWNFVRSESNNPSQGIREKWYTDDLARFRKTIQMPVPSSYNDVTEDAGLRDHVGTVWYDRKFFVPRAWSKGDDRVFLRFGSVHYSTIVWINGVQVMTHEFGHLPFEADVTKALKYGAENRITVLCDNVLLQVTVPQGKVDNQAIDNGVELVQSYTFDFFNYAGIHRSVVLYTVPRVYIRDVVIHTSYEGDEGRVDYQVTTSTNETDHLLLKVKLYDRNGTLVSKDESEAKLQGTVVVPQVQLWWPYLMHPEPGYLYTMEITLGKAQSNDAPTDEKEEDTVLDVYRFKVGIRTLEWNNSSFLINGKPIYFRGFGRHEDSDIRGKGLDLALLTKDFNLLKWVGANAYRTSHYPYSEESMQFADEHGIMIIDECPSVDTENFSQILLEKHKSSIEQLIHRDRNHPSVVMWSIANEPRTGKMVASPYFEAVAQYTKKLDPTRPITAAIAVNVNDDVAAQYLDIVSFNRYNAWYANSGKLNMITNRVIEEAEAWNKKHNKPVLMSEYGADTQEGLHTLPAYIWSEDYQTRVFSQHFKAFDALRKQNFFIGEFVWNFADFKTAQSKAKTRSNPDGDGSLQLKRSMFSLSSLQRTHVSGATRRAFLLATGNRRRPRICCASGTTRWASWARVTCRTICSCTRPPRTASYHMRRRNCRERENE
ncbi:beta-glucuronidase isoform X4 [Anopheles gambiae]|uniref:beta-glucuronidase isoform X4 n=1 Tax=Anopheles gambiae TaxID=7165 RepID=UPI002AC99745|nr:beta-glucuronidase isoform X4 [Anopheles gambiae]